jgi:Zn2+/Cd2+-exporting ATPase
VGQPQFNINFLMTVAGLGAVVIGEYAEAAALILLFDLAEALEGFTNERARGAIAQLQELSPTHAVRLKDGESAWCRWKIWPLARRSWSARVSASRWMG